MSAFDLPAGRMTRAAEVVKAAEAAEREIQRLLIALEETTRMSVDHVDVDTRNFGQLRTEITLTTRVRR